MHTVTMSKTDALAKKISERKAFHTRRYPCSLTVENQVAKGSTGSAQLEGGSGSHKKHLGLLQMWLSAGWCRYDRRARTHRSSRR